MSIPEWSAKRSRRCGSRSQDVGVCVRSKKRSVFRLAMKFLKAERKASGRVDGSRLEGAMSENDRAPPR